MDVGELSKKNGYILRLRPNLLSTGVENGGSFYDLVFEPTGETLAFDSARLFRAQVVVTSRRSFAPSLLVEELYSARQRKFYVAPD